MASIIEPTADCPLCPRLAGLRNALRATHPDWFNAPVPVFGTADAWLAIVGLAPGLKGANRTGRAFTGDGSGAMLFDVLTALGLARGAYGGHAGDGLTLDGTMIVNAARCVPPENRPTPAEVRACRPHLAASLAAAPGRRVIVALGRIAHDATLAALALRRARHPFGHGAEHRLDGSLVLIDSYHCSRYNQNVGRITREMLGAIFRSAMALRDGADAHRHENIANSACKVSKILD